MRTPIGLVLGCSSLLLAAACAGSSDRTDTGAAMARSDTGMAMAPAASPAAGEPVAAIIVLYHPPKDTAAFEKYYNETHLPIVSSHQQEIGFTKTLYEKISSQANGKAAPYYRKAELWFPSREALDAGMKTEGFQKAAGDIPKFASGGFTVLIAQETR
jgi:uncharacterized protein (TIGR02118 family)